MWPRRARARVAHLLCELHARMKLIGLVSSDDRFALALTQEEVRAVVGTAAAFAARAERTGSATMVLSVGNKHSAPTKDERYGGVDAVGSLSKRDVKGKGKAAKGGR